MEETSKKSWAKRNPSRVNEISKLWRARNLERARENGRKSEAKRRTQKHEEWLNKKRKWNAANRDKCYLYSRRVLCKKHGITIEIYEELLRRQGGVCAICKNPESERKGKLSIDHDHKCCQGKQSCGKCIRGLLCTKCNQAIGCFNESRETIVAALNYIEKGVSDV